MTANRKVSGALIWIAASAAVLVIGCAAGIQLARGTVQDPGQLLFNGYVKPEVNCYYCHNGDGRGAGRGPDLSKAVPKMPDAEVLKIITKGASFMPAFGDKLSEPERAQILAWLRSAFGGGSAAATKEVEAEQVK